MVLIDYTSVMTQVQMPMWLLIQVADADVKLEAISVSRGASRSDLVH